MFFLTEKTLSWNIIRSNSHSALTATLSVQVYHLDRIKKAECWTVPGLIRDVVVRSTRRMGKTYELHDSVCTSVSLLSQIRSVRDAFSFLKVSANYFKTWLGANSLCGTKKTSRMKTFQGGNSDIKFQVSDSQPTHTVLSQTFFSKCNLTTSIKESKCSCCYCFLMSLSGTLLLQ